MDMSFAVDGHYCNHFNSSQWPLLSVKRKLHHRYVAYTCKHRDVYTCSVRASTETSIRGLYVQAQARLYMPCTCKRRHVYTCPIRASVDTSIRALYVQVQRRLYVLCTCKFRDVYTCSVRASSETSIRSLYVQTQRRLYVLCTCKRRDVFLRRSVICELLESLPIQSYDKM